MLVTGRVAERANGIALRFCRTMINCMRSEGRKARQEEKYSTKRRQFAMTDADSEAFSSALRDAFPTIRFVRYPSQSHLKKTLGRDELWPEDFTLMYCESLAHRIDLDSPEIWRWDRDGFTSWLEPDDWEPFWIGPTPYGHYIIANKPKLFFWYSESSIYHRRSESTISGGHISSSFPKGDKEFISFLNKVWRIFGKLTTNVLTAVDKKRNLPYRPAEPQFMCACGYHALAWMRKEPNRYVFDNLRPPEDGENGPYAPMPKPLPR